MLLSKSSVIFRRRTKISGFSTVDDGTICFIITADPHRCVLKKCMGIGKTADRIKLQGVVSVFG